MDYTFAEFFAVWANIQQWKIPKVHLDIITFLEDEDWVTNSKVLLLWRSIGKSTITDLWVSYKLSKNPKLRFLILSADLESAKKSSQDILYIINNHPWCPHLINNKLETTKTSFFVNGSTDARNPSVRAKGITSNITSSRADIIIYDDVEVQKNSGSTLKREDLRERIAETGKFLATKILGGTHHGRRLFIGTYHDPISIYDEMQEKGAKSLTVPLLKNITGVFPNITGESNWPELFTADVVSNIQRDVCHSRAEFYSQYLLVPTGIEEAYLDPTLVNMYDDELIINEVNDTTVAKIGERVVKSVSCWWDPSLSKARRDDSVLAVVYTTTIGEVMVHRAVTLHGDADEQCLQVKRICHDLEIPIVKIETNGIGGYLPQLLLKHLNGTGTGVAGIHTSMNKQQKIVENLETLLYSGNLFVSGSVRKTKFLDQMRDFKPTHQHQLDDHIDAVASAIKEEPIRVAGTPMPVPDSAYSGAYGETSGEIKTDSFKF